MPFNCVVLAAGYASRLGELVTDCPKALLPYETGTILSHLFDRLECLPDLDEICIVTNESFKEHFVAWLATRTSSKRIHLVSNGIDREEDARGANRAGWCG